LQARQGDRVLDVGERGVAALANAALVRWLFLGRFAQAPPFPLPQGRRGAPRLKTPGTRGTIAAMRRARGLFLLLPLALGLAGCGVSLSDIRQESLLDRCGDLMREAFPGGDIKVTRTSTVAQPTQSIATVVAAAEGQRRDLPKNTVLDRRVAVECRFTNSILTDFRWTKGPLR
jgi:hypothetical protein